LWWVFFSFFFFYRWGLENYLLGMARNCDPPDLCLLSRKDYRREPLAHCYF
jgi:hypothetical protein